MSNVYDISIKRVTRGFLLVTNNGIDCAGQTYAFDHVRDLADFIVQEWHLTESEVPLRAEKEEDA